MLRRLEMCHVLPAVGDNLGCRSGLATMNDRRLRRIDLRGAAEEAQRAERRTVCGRCTEFLHIILHTTRSSNLAHGIGEHAVKELCMPRHDRIIEPSKIQRMIEGGFHGRPV